MVRISSVAAISHLTAGRSQIGTSLSFHLFFAVLGVGLAVDDARRRGDASADGRSRVAGAGASLVEGVRDPVRGGRGVGHDHQLRAGACCCRGSWRSRAGSSACRSRSRARRSSSRRSSSGSTSTAGTVSRRARIGCRGSRSRSPPSASAFFIVTANAWMNVPRGFQIVHGHVTHVERAGGDVQPGVGDRDLAHGARRLSRDRVRRRQPSTRSGCCAAAATPITARRSRWRWRLAAIIAPLQLGRRRPARSHGRPASAGDAGGDRGRHPYRDGAPA